MMGISKAKAEKPLRKLRKLLREWPSDPAIQDVHQLRTRIRDAEAIAHAFMMGDEKSIAKLRQELKPIRRSAGGVRDLDVLMANASTLPQDNGTEALIRLLQHLAAMRNSGAKDLHQTVSRHQKKARHRLKQLAKQARTNLDGSKEPAQVGETAKVAATAMDIVARLSAWPKLDKSNLHLFRKEAKTLRSTLLLADTPDAVFVGALKQVKDEIGIWHDWLQLEIIAKEVSQEHEAGEMLRQIGAKVDSSFQQAMSTANATRRRYFPASPKRRAKTRPVVIKDAAIKASARLAG